MLRREGRWERRGSRWREKEIVLAGDDESGKDEQRKNEKEKRRESGKNKYDDLILSVQAVLLPPADIPSETCCQITHSEE